ncbi:MAG: hypothetical protein HY904_04470 [Deltaproteobacteria bacterium]|nr:hypothetical protein [Deltaproteobacteria bacterium]
MVAANKTATYIVMFLALVGLYFGFIFIPIWWGNFQLKQAAREWIAVSREKSYRMRAYETFKKQSAVILGKELPEDSCIYVEGETVDGAKVNCEYINVAVFYGTGKTKPMRFKWTVAQSYQKF